MSLNITQHRYVYNNTTINMLYQVKWFSKKKGYGFVHDSEGKEYFVHHSDIQAQEGFRFLRQGEVIMGEPQSIDGDDSKVKIANMRSPMEGGLLMCQVERNARAAARSTTQEGSS